MTVPAPMYTVASLGRVNALAKAPHEPEQRLLEGAFSTLGAESNTVRVLAAVSLSTYPSGESC